MNKKAISSIAAAVALGTGIAVYEFSGNTTLKSGNSDIDWNIYDLNVPTIEVPTIEVPTVNVPKIDIDLGNENIAILNSNNVELSVPKVDAPKISAPNLISLILKIDSLDLSKLSVEDLKEINLNINELNAPIVEVPNLPDMQAELNEWLKMQKLINATFIDDRMTQYDTSLTPENKHLKEWLKIYKQYETIQPIQYVKIDKPFRMITEVCIPSSYDELKTLDENLKFYKLEGYDSVLVAFGVNDASYNVLNIIKYIRQYHQMDAWLTFTAKEDLRRFTFGDPKKYEETLKICAPYVVGYINSWRGTSAHLWKQDAAFMNFTNSVLRKANPSIKIIGELYYGNTYKYSSENNVGFETNIFENASGIMISNFGYSNVDYDRLMNKIIKPRIGDFEPIGIVIGTNAYYLGEYANNLTYQENIQAKHKIEVSFMKHGCVATITMHDDGRGFNDKNDLCKTLYSTLSSKIDK